MDNSNLKKKLSVYVTDKGYLKNVSDEVLYEILVAWENWSGSSKEFYRSLGFTAAQMAALIGKAKKYKRQGHFGEQGKASRRLPLKRRLLRPFLALVGQLRSSGRTDS